MAVKAIDQPSVFDALGRSYCLTTTHSVDAAQCPILVGLLVLRPTTDRGGPPEEMESLLTGHLPLRSQPPTATTSQTLRSMSIRPCDNVVYDTPKGAHHAIPKS
jgi:hypothetical protein